MKKVLVTILYIIIILFIIISLAFFGVLGCIAYTFANFKLAFMIFGFILFCVILFVIGIVLAIKEK